MNPNNFSNWFPKVKDCGIPVPKSFWTKVPDDERLREAFFLEDIKADYAAIQDWLEADVIPKLDDLNLTGHIFVKNGTFSNKFNANAACNQYGTVNLHRAVADINYNGLFFGAGGTDELVVREYIESDHRITPCIYNGLPLRSEFRVFYDFDSAAPIFTVNYWYYDYVYPHLYNATDKIVFEHEKSRLESTFEARKDEVQTLVADAMKKVQGLTGQWSVDILLDESGTFWLIDMAVAQNSAYWNMRPDTWDQSSKAAAEEKEEATLSENS